MERYTRGINQTRRRAHKPSFPIIKVGSRASVANRPETACSKAHGETSVLLNFTDFPSPLYRFIYYRPVARIISISVKQRPIVDAIYDRFTWTPPPLSLSLTPLRPRILHVFLTAFPLHKRSNTSVEENDEPRIHEPEHGPPPYYLSRTLVPPLRRERMVTVSSGVYDRLA